MPGQGTQDEKVGGSGKSGSVASLAADVDRTADKINFSPQFHRLLSALRFRNRLQLAADSPRPRGSSCRLLPGCSRPPNYHSAAAHHAQRQVTSIKRWIQR